MNVDAALGVRGDVLPRGALVLVTDTVETSAEFVVSHFLRRALAASDAARAAADAADGGGGGGEWKTCLVTSERCVAHHANAMRKWGRNLRADVKDGKLVVVDAHDSTPGWATTRARGGDGDGDGDAVIDESSPAKDVYEQIARALGLNDGAGDEDGGASSSSSSSSSAAASRVVVFDGVDAIAEAEESLERRRGRRGDRTRAPVTSRGRVHAMVRSLLAHESGVAVVALAHADAAGGEAIESGGWLRRLTSDADVVARVEALPSGVASDVHGLITATHRTGRMLPPPGDGDGDAARAGEASARFRLTELGAELTRVIRSRAVAADATA